MPRQVLPGSTYLITRRCAQRQFLLKPSPRTNAIIAFYLAYAAEKTSVALHAVCAMSNHLHVVATDPHGRLPEFTHLLHLYISKCLNASYGHWENLWASEPPSAVRLEDQAVRRHTTTTARVLRCALAIDASPTRYLGSRR